MSTVVVVKKRKPLRRPVRPTIETTQERKERKAQLRATLLALLSAQWPQTFPQDTRAVRPWATGIHQELIARLTDLSHKRARLAIGYYYQRARKHYLQALARGGDRYDLDGNPRGAVTPEEQQQARDALRQYDHSKRRKEK